MISFPWRHHRRRDGLRDPPTRDVLHLCRTPLYYIGNQGAGDESQTIRIGTVQTQTFMAGINTAGVSGLAVVVDAYGRLGIMLSSARYKRDIAPMGTRSEKVLDRRPVTFAYKDDDTTWPQPTPQKGHTVVVLVAPRVLGGGTAAALPDGTTAPIAAVPVATPLLHTSENANSGPRRSHSRRSSLRL